MPVSFLTRHCRRLLLLMGLIPLFGAQAEPIQLQDHRGKTLVLPSKAQRVISLAPNITEMLYSAGAGPALVGVVEYSDYPAAALSLPKVGSFAQFDYEKILQLRPDLVVAWHSGNPPEKIAHLERLGLRVYVMEPRSTEAIAQQVLVLAQAAGDLPQAQAATKGFLARLAALRQEYAAAAPVRVFYQIWDQPLMTLNGEHLFNDLLAVCGGRNVFAALPGVAPKIDTEAVLAAGPELILASGTASERPAWLDAWQRWPQLRAVKTAQLQVIPADLLQRQTLRVAEGAELLCAQLQAVRKARAAAQGPSL
jgi:iron complex transport system substrate-binding protein